MRWRTMVVSSLAVATLVVGCGTQPQLVMEPEVAAPPRDGVVIHISHGPEDAHRVLMALQMAVLMAADHDVLVYLDIHGIDVVLDLFSRYVVAWMVAQRESAALAERLIREACQKQGHRIT